MKVGLSVINGLTNTPVVGGVSATNNISGGNN